MNAGHENWSATELEQYQRSARRVCLILLTILVALFFSLPARTPGLSAPAASSDREPALVLSGTRSGPRERLARSPGS